jgi:hypothetical protein
MLRVDEFRFYDLGSKVHPISRYRSPIKYGDVLWPLWEARVSLSGFQKDPMRLRVCAPATEKLLGAINEVVPSDLDGATAKDSKTALGPYDIYLLTTSAQEFETVLAAELNASASYFVSQVGAYSTSNLIDEAEIIFPDSIRLGLPDQARKDVREMGRCLAFNLPTAAGFHILRAVETVMASYYTALLGSAPPDQGRNWGAWIKLLRDSGKAEAKVLGFLEHLKDEYRNPVTHPEVFLSMDEVQVLLGAAIGAISQMVLATPKPSAAATPFAIVPKPAAHT